jgi:multiple sugar transport system substrate-binding protein
VAAAQEGTVLEGCSWGHARGHDPLVATAERFAAEHGVRVNWTPRTLTEFGIADVATLAARYDLVVIDHPHVGVIARNGSLVALDEYIDAATLDALGERSPGGSHQSYFYGGRQFALAIDAAVQVSAWRPDLLSDPPRAWEDVIELARGGRVVWPLNPVDSEASFMSVMAAQGTPLQVTADPFIDPAAGRAALETMFAVSRHLDACCFESNAIAALEQLSTSDDVAYCPFVFGYTNYARAGFRPSVLRFGDVPALRGRPAAGALLGGVGLGVSAVGKHVETAVELALFTAAPDVQRTTFFAAGGQPAHRAAWDDRELDRATGGFYSGTLGTLERSWMRPRVPDFVSWQNDALHVVHDALIAGPAAFSDAIARLNQIAAGLRLDVA